MKDQERSGLHGFRAAVERTLNSGPYGERFENCVETGTGSLRVVVEGYAYPRLVTFAQSGTMHTPEGVESLPESRMVEGDLYQLTGADEWILLPGAGLRHSPFGPVAALLAAVDGVEVSPGRWHVRVPGGLGDRELREANEAARGLSGEDGEGTAVPAVEPLPEWASVVIESGIVREVRYPVAE
ncbi:hypothetical protein [Rothia halotolerans]|uniref:hypothetical protein n=1 Tax=Rothia halotolerans TaxID=405770 RepID=UPI00101CF06E|nr:hypothetical protein [Rothia halotolerans]